MRESESESEAPMLELASSEPPLQIEQSGQELGLPDHSQSENSQSVRDQIAQPQSAVDRVTSDNSDEASPHQREQQNTETPQATSDLVVSQVIPGILSEKSSVPPILARKVSAPPGGDPKDTQPGNEAIEELALSANRTAPPVAAIGYQSDDNAEQKPAPHSTAPTPKFAFYMWPIWLIGRGWDLASLCILLAVVAAIPIIQLASLGYLLHSAANLAQGKPWRSSLPGLRLSGKIGTFALLASLSWLPVWLVTDLSYSAQLLQPNTAAANGWRIGAFLITTLWMAHLTWAAIRGGRWWHLLWPAPIRFVKDFWRRSTWSKASDELYELVAKLRFLELWWLGARASVGALLWVVLPVSLMIIGQRADDVPAAGLVGFIGAAAMTLIMLYLPFLQIQLAKHNRFTAIFDVLEARRRFRFAPISHALALLAMVALCIPLYLLRIEPIADELVWAPALVFVLFMLPAKVLLGASMGYADSRKELELRPRAFYLRWPSRLLGLASVLIYVGALYVAQLVAGQGAPGMYFQHAFLVPAPFF